jgi:23S rRNA-/tRNA-specific pseudouridylate synthase
MTRVCGGRERRRAGWAYSLVRVRILTGRRHQIRRHLACIGHPVCGDPLYRNLASLPPTSKQTAKGPSNR